MASKNNGNQNKTPETVKDRPNTTNSGRETNPQDPTKSTNSRPVRRKVPSCFYPDRAGCLLPFIYSHNDGYKNKEGFKDLYVSFANRFDMYDVVNGLLVELLMLDYWRVFQGVRYELKFTECEKFRYFPSSGLDVIARYTNAARRNLDRSIEMLRKIEKETAEAEFLEPAEEPETVSPADDSSSSPSQANTTPFADEPCPNVIDIHDFLPESDFSPHTDWDDEDSANNNPDVSEEQPPASTPLPTSDEPAAQQTSAVASESAECPAKTIGEMLGVDVPKAA